MLLKHRHSWLLACLVAAAASVAPAQPVAPAPASAEVDRGAVLTRIAFGSCAHQDRPQPIWDVVRAQSPDLFIWAGDNIYADTEDIAVMRQKYARLAAIPGYAALAAETPVLATWDDHDFGRNDAGREYPQREASQEAFLDFFGVPDDSPRRSRAGVYHAEVFGPPGRRVQVILLDTRYHRSPLEKYPQREGERGGVYKPVVADDATMLGPEQWAWLEEQLREPADARLIVSSIQVISAEHRFEKWSNLPTERSRLFRLIAETGAEGVVFLTGDRHHAELSRYDSNRLYPLYDLTASGINQSRPGQPGDRRPPEPNRYRVGPPYRGHHFGLVEIDWDEPDPTLRLRIIDDAGAAAIDHEVKLSTLRFPSEEASPPPADAPVTATQLDDAPDAPDAPIRLDGDDAEWADGRAMVADPHRLYLRFTTGDTRTLRRHVEDTVIGIDADGDAGTGGKLGELAGVDLVIQTSPPPAPDGNRWGMRLTRLRSDDSAPELLEPAELPVQAAPTHASSTFEVAIDRRGPLAESLGLAAPGVKRAAVVAVNKETDETRPLLEAAAVAVEADPSAPASATIPTKPAGAVRVLALNTLWGSQLADPSPFTRVFRALDADIYLLQEWSRERATDAEIAAWFRDHVDAETTWQVMAPGTPEMRFTGVAVVSRHPIEHRLPMHTPVSTERWDFPARLAGASFHTPAGTVIAASVHYKAGGSYQSDEDTRRLAEAEAVNRMLAGFAAAHGPHLMVLGGDFNLNGDPRVMEVSTRGLDADGSHLTVAPAEVLGRPGMMDTHGGPGGRNRLDFITYPDAAATAAHAFVLDASALDPSALEAADLLPGDTAVSDHRPVVVDLLPR